ncbi:hypothetical protein Rs2_15863 [Raphanus sativus]|nr:hypothetical protein Rs2_15863 [Raphanus sativus]
MCNPSGSEGPPSAGATHFLFRDQETGIALAARNPRTISLLAGGTGSTASYLSSTMIGTDNEPEAWGGTSRDCISERSPTSGRIRTSEPEAGVSVATGEDVFSSAAWMISFSALRQAILSRNQRKPATQVGSGTDSSTGANGASVISTSEFFLPS